MRKNKLLHLISNNLDQFVLSTSEVLRFWKAIANVFLNKRSKNSSKKKRVQQKCQQLVEKGKVWQVI